MIHLAAPGDTIRITAQDVTLLDLNSIPQPVTSGLVGTVSLKDWDDDELELGPATILLHAGDDWYVDVTAPGAGRYRVVVVIQAGGAQRTLHAELKVQAPPT